MSGGSDGGVVGTPQAERNFHLERSGPAKQLYDGFEYEL